MSKNAMKKGVTLKDLAARLNMSVSTVSKALADDPSISAPTRERAKQLADEWQYVPNEAARHFQQNKTFTLGLIIPDLLDQFYVLGINGVEEVAAHNRYSVIISQTHESVEAESAIVDLMIRNRVDGVIVTTTKHTTDMSPFHKLMRNGIPVVFLSRAPTEPVFDYVSVDNLDGTLQAMEFLFQRGHTRIAHLMGPPAMPVSRYRLEGYKIALARRGISFDPLLVREIDLTPESTYAAMEGLMSLSSPPTAIFIFKNYASLEALAYLRKVQPDGFEKMELVGFGNLPLIQYLDHKPLASIEENAQEMGRQAAELLLRNIDLPDIEARLTPEHVKVVCRLVVNE